MKTSRFYGMDPGTPDDHGLGRSAAVNVALALAVLTAVAGAAAYRLALGPPFVVKAVGTFVVGALLMLTMLQAHRPHERFGPANQVTLARAILVALLAGLIGERAVSTSPGFVLLLAIPALALDGLDGWLARRTRMQSAFGARFDMETDALLVMVLCVLAWEGGKAGAWILLAGLLRYLFVAAGAVLPWMARPLAPSMRRKVVCVVQVIALLVVLAPFVAPPVSDAVAAASLVLLAASFAIDVRWLAGRARLPL